MQDDGVEKQRSSAPDGGCISVRFSRRGFLGLAGGAAAGLAVQPATAFAAPKVSTGSRSLSFRTNPRKPAARLHGSQNHFHNYPTMPARFGASTTSALTHFASKVPRTLNRQSSTGFYERLATKPGTQHLPY